MPELPRINTEEIVKEVVKTIFKPTQAKYQKAIPKPVPIDPEKRARQAVVAAEDPFRYLMEGSVRDLERRGHDGQQLYSKLRNYLHRNPAVYNEYNHSISFPGLSKETIFGFFDRITALPTQEHDTNSDEEPSTLTAQQKVQTIIDMVELLSSFYDEEYKRFTHERVDNDHDYLEMLECIQIHPDIAPFMSSGEEQLQDSMFRSSAATETTETPHQAMHRSWPEIELEVKLSHAENPEHATTIVIKYLRDLSLETPSQRSYALRKIEDLRATIVNIPFRGTPGAYKESIRKLLNHKVSAVRERELLEAQRPSIQNPKETYGEYGWIAIETVRQAVYSQNVLAEDDLITRAIPSALDVIFGTPSMQMSHRQRIEAIKEILHVIESADYLQPKVKRRAIGVFRGDHRVKHFITALSAFDSA